jgi:hypothetical protein
MYFSQAVLLSGAIGGVFAVPSRHAHLHRDVRARDVTTVIGTVVQTTTLWVEAGAPSPSGQGVLPSTSHPDIGIISTSTTSGVASNPTSTSPSSPKAFCSSSSKHKRATDSQINYAGNLGTTGGCSWGSNWMAISEPDLGSFNYTITINNAGSEDMECICANKMGYDGKLDGSFAVSSSSQSPLTFNVSPGSSAFVAVEPNTQGMIMCNPNTVPTSSYGQYMGVWLEVDLADTANSGWSGADISALAAQAGGQTSLPGGYVDTATGSGSPSWICPGGTPYKNAYVDGLQAVDGAGLNLPAGPVSLVYTVGKPPAC